MPAAPVPLRFSETARSGTRMLMALPVTLEIADAAGGTFKENTQTIVINRTGAKVLAAAPLPVGSKVTLSVGSGKGQRITPAMVVWAGEKRGAKTEIGLEIEQADGAFWGVLFPDDSGSFPPGSFSGGAAKTSAPAPAPAPASTATQVPVPPAASAASQTLQSPAQTLPASAPESAAGTPGAPSIGLAEELIAAKQQLDGHVANALEKMNEGLRQAIAATLDPAVHAAKNDLIRLSAQYSQSAQKGVEGISKAAERTIAAVEQRSLQSALNTQMVVEQRLQMRLQECETVLASIEQQAAIKLDERVQAHIRESEPRWKQALDKIIQERLESQLDAMQATLMVTAQQVMESQMEEFAHRLQSLAESFAQDLADRSLTPVLVKKAATH